jgi:tetratricopeptide (TPR) repeat protein
VFAQSDARTRADSLVRDGDLAANDSRPRAAIDAYERAIAVDPSRRVALLPRLGPQYLWSDAPRQAARLFTDYLATNPTSCETKLDLGLALSWANELDAATRDLRHGRDELSVRAWAGATRCRSRSAVGQPFLGRRAAVSCRAGDGNDGDREQAAIGLAYVRLARAEPRAALALADSLLATGSHDPSLIEARIMALADSAR